VGTHFEYGQDLNPVTMPGLGQMGIWLAFGAGLVNQLLWQTLLTHKIYDWGQIADEVKSRLEKEEEKGEDKKGDLETQLSQ